MIDLGFMSRMAYRFALSPYWQGATTESLSKQRLLDFYAVIYPVWFPIVRKAMLDEQQDWAKHAATKQSGIESETPHGYQDLDVLHRCDMAIFNSGYKPQRESLESELARQSRSRGTEKARRSYPSGQDQAAGL